MEYLLLYAFIEVVGYGTDKHSLCQCGDFAWWNKAVHLGVERMTHILTVD